MILLATYLVVGIVIAGMDLKSGGNIFKCINSNSELRNLDKKESFRRAIIFPVLWLPLTLSGSESLSTGSHCVQ